MCIFIYKEYLQDLYSNVSSINSQNFHYHIQSMYKFNHSPPNQFIYMDNILENLTLTHDTEFLFQLLRTMIVSSKSLSSVHFLELNFCYKEKPRNYSLCLNAAFLPVPPDNGIQLRAIDYDNLNHTLILITFHIVHLPSCQNNV